MQELDTSIRQALEAYQAAVFAQDAEAFVALYDQDAVVFDLWGAWSHNGVEAWRGAVKDWFGSLGSERVLVAFHDVQATVGGDFAVVHAFVTYQGVSAEGKELRAMQNRLTWALRQTGGAWKILHEHTSAPVNPETSKVILQR